MTQRENINEALVESLLAVSRRIEETGDLIFSKAGVTFSTFEVLLKINDGINTSTSLKKSLGGNMSSIAHKVKFLEQKKLIERRNDENDKRKWHFHCTKKGEETLLVSTDLYTHSLSELFKSYTDEQKGFALKFICEISAHLSDVANKKDDLESFIKNHKRK